MMLEDIMGQCFRIIDVTQHHEYNSSQLKLHQPGIEPGSVPWQGTILPLDHWCLILSFTEL
ncbi:hypothetical protein MTR_1g097200 [Medicago truncatula]|uniref:Uncharacterized protein n=1 Tax=Medicago truncatula TaxID=3880 RepID=A0A072VZW2_MEDTR|nr:hypothetical protein MTR_1g097200 [Medicago truncatula]